MSTEDRFEEDRIKEKLEEINYAQAVARLKSILEIHNMRLSFADYGCGCCGSGVIKFEYNGEIILDNSDEASMFRNHDFSMFDEPENVKN